MVRAFELALVFDRPVYDCLYLACVEQADGVLVTTNRHIMKAVIGSPFADRIHHLAALPANLIAA
jgi:predicted nucleic acid-binding protein